MKVMEINSVKERFKREAGALVAVGEDGAYAEIYPLTTPETIRAVHLELAAHGYELMDPDECPGEVSGDGLGMRFWAAKIDGGNE